MSLTSDAAQTNAAVQRCTNSFGGQHRRHTTEASSGEIGLEVQLSFYAYIHIGSGICFRAPSGAAPRSLSRNFSNRHGSDRGWPHAQSYETLRAMATRCVSARNGPWSKNRARSGGAATMAAIHRAYHTPLIPASFQLSGRETSQMGGRRTQRCTRDVLPMRPYRQRRSSGAVFACLFKNELLGKLRANRQDVADDVPEAKDEDVAADVPEAEDEDVAEDVPGTKICKSCPGSCPI